jgi:hypothetical protein
MGSDALELQILSQLSELSQQLGVVQAQCAHIIKDQDAATERRAKMYEKLDEIPGIKTTLERITPLVEDHEKKHQRAIGAVWLARGLWIISGGAVGAAAVTWFNRLISGPPHP